MPQSDGADAQRRALETRHARVIAAALTGQRTQVIPRNTAAATLGSGIPDRLRQSSAVLTKALQATLLDGAQLGVVHANSRMLHKADATISTNADLINQDVLAWVQQYGFDLVGGINQTTATLLLLVLSDYIDGTITYADLTDQLEPVFGAARADLISSTEITRSFAQGAATAAARAGITWLMWNGANDEHECEECSDADGNVYSVNDSDQIPAHPMCRCWWSPSANGP